MSLMSFQFLMTFREDTKQEGNLPALTYTKTFKNMAEHGSGQLNLILSSYSMKKIHDCWACDQNVNLSIPQISEYQPVHFMWRSLWLRLAKIKQPKTHLIQEEHSIFSRCRSGDRQGGSRQRDIG